MTNWNNIIEKELEKRIKVTNKVHNQDLVFWVMKKYNKTEKTANKMVEKYSNTYSVDAVDEEDNDYP